MQNFTDRKICIGGKLNKGKETERRKTCSTLQHKVLWMQNKVDRLKVTVYMVLKYGIETNKINDNLSIIIIIFYIVSDLTKQVTKKCAQVSPINAVSKRLVTQ